MSLVSVSSKNFAQINSKEFGNNCSFHELWSYIGSVLIHEFLDVFALNFAASVIRIKVEYQHGCTETCNANMCHIEPKYVDDHQPDPY